MIQTHRFRARFQDRLAWTIGRLTGLGVNDPKKYPKIDAFLGIEKPATPAQEVAMWRAAFAAAGAPVVNKD